MLLQVRRGASEEKKMTVVEEWYREQIRTVVPILIAKWEPLVGVKVKRFFVRKMKTKWGSCNPRTHSIRFNTDLAKKPTACLEYILVHEMAHLIERAHNARFIALMDRFLPSWRHLREELNRAPLGHATWNY